MTNTYFLILAATFGLIFGSFANVVVLRDKKRKSVLTGRSHCPHCRHVLAWYDLFPVVSFLLLKGRCRYCQRNISWQYPLVEITAALLAVFAYWYGWIVQYDIRQVILLFAALFLLLVTSVMDLRTMEISLDYVVLAGLLLGVAYWLRTLEPWPAVIFGLIIGAGAIAFVVYGWKLAFKQEGMGVGDIWLSGVVGLAVGYPGVIIALLSAIFSGALAGIMLMLIKRKSMNSAMPFGPFLCLGMLIAIVWGDLLLDWYLYNL